MAGAAGGRGAVGEGEAGIGRNARARAGAALLALVLLLCGAPVVGQNQDCQDYCGARVPASEVSHCNSWCPQAAMFGSGPGAITTDKCSRSCADLSSVTTNEEFDACSKGCLFMAVCTTCSTACTIGTTGTVACPSTGGSSSDMGVFLIVGIVVGALLLILIAICFCRPCVWCRPGDEEAEETSFSGGDFTKDHQPVNETRRMELRNAAQQLREVIERQSTDMQLSYGLGTEDCDQPDQGSLAPRRPIEYADIRLLARQTSAPELGGIKAQQAKQSRTETEYAKIDAFRTLALQKALGNESEATMSMHDAASSVAPSEADRREQPTVTVDQAPTEPDLSKKARSSLPWRETARRPSRQAPDPPKPRRGSRFRTEKPVARRLTRHDTGARPGQTARAVPPRPSFGGASVNADRRRDSVQSNASRGSRASRQPDMDMIGGTPPSVNELTIAGEGLFELDPDALLVSPPTSDAGNTDYLSVASQGFGQAPSPPSGPSLSVEEDDAGSDVNSLICTGNDNFWSHGFKDAELAEDDMAAFANLMEQEESNGLFLVRQEPDSAEWFLSVMYEGIVFHYQIHLEEDGLYLGGRGFASMTELIEYYSESRDRTLITQLGPICELKQPGQRSRSYSIKSNNSCA